MRAAAFAFFILCSRIAIGQSDSLVQVFFERPETINLEVTFGYRSCDEAINAAVHDSNSGTLKCLWQLSFFGDDDFDFENFQSNYLIVNYGIERESRGCIGFPYEECYFDKMNEIILQKYGPNFFEELTESVEKEYKNFKSLSNREKRKFIDMNYVYSNVDERAKYSGGLAELQARLREKINFSNFDFSGFKLKGFHTEVLVNENGEIESCRVVSRNFPPDANKAIQKAVKEIGGWKAATLYGSKVKSRTGFSFIF